MLIETEVLIFIGMVFAAVMLLTMGITVPVFGESKQARKKIQKRLRNIRTEANKPAIGSLLREKYLKRLGPIERVLEQTPMMERMAMLIEQSGNTYLAYRFVLFSLVLGLLLGGVSLWFLKDPIIAVLIFIGGGVAPYFKIVHDRNERMAQFDEQLPEAIDIMRRALQAGHPFSETLHLVADGLDGPISKEFGITFADLNYGSDMRRAMLGLLERMPSVTLMAFVTSVLVQKETGGNLSEILNNISRVIRGRFKFQRKVRTLSAEGRMSAWILAMVPFGLFLLIHFTTPDYLDVLFEKELGRQLIMYAGILGFFGILWIRQILKIEV